MLANDQLLTLPLSSPQAAGIAAWLQKCNLDGSPRPGSPSVLEALAAHLDDARWIARWLREEPQLAVPQADTLCICQAIHEALRSVSPSHQERLALESLVSELECAASGQAPQLACASAMAFSGADARS